MKLRLLGLVSALLLTGCASGGDSDNSPFSDDPRCATFQQEWLNLQMAAELSTDEDEKQRLLRLADSVENQIGFIENCSLD